MLVSCNSIPNTEHVEECTTDRMRHGVCGAWGG